MTFYLLLPFLCKKISIKIFYWKNESDTFETKPTTFRITCKIQKEQSNILNFTVKLTKCQPGGRH